MGEKDRARFLFERARKSLLGLTEDIPTDKWCWQPFAGANHVMWNVGHISMVDTLAIESLTGAPPPVPAGYTGLFGPKSTPMGDAGKYPSTDEIAAYLRAQRERLLTALDVVEDDVMARPMSGRWRDFWPDVGAMLLSLPAHESFHAGEIAAVRKALGLKPKFL